MILRDYVKTEKTPWITYLLILVNVLVFVLTVFVGEDVFKIFGIVPSQLNLITSYTLITAMFVHGGLMHLFWNMVFLFIFGDNVEDNLGKFKFLMFYLITGMIASYSHVVFNLDSNIPLVGASGAISGLMGAYYILYGGFAKIRTFIPWIFLLVLSLVGSLFSGSPFYGFLIIIFAIVIGGVFKDIMQSLQRFTVDIPVAIYLGWWIANQVVNAASISEGGIAFLAHVGGFFAGLGLIIYLMKGKSVKGEVIDPASLD